MHGVLISKELRRWLYRNYVGRWTRSVCESGLSGAGFSLRNFVFARTKPRRLKPRAT
jgi:hypothetical protein